MTTPHTTTHIHTTTSAEPFTLEDTMSSSCSEQGWSITIDMNKLLQLYPASQASNIYLGDPTCKGEQSYGLLLFQYPLRECFTREIAREGVLEYVSEMIYAERVYNKPYIIRTFNWTIGIECVLQHNETSSSGDISPDTTDNRSSEIDETRRNQYGVGVAFFRDDRFDMPLYGSPLVVAAGTEQLFVKVYTTSDDQNMTMRVHTCYTAPAANATKDDRQYLIQDGCRVDNSTQLISTMEHETRFSFVDMPDTADQDGLLVSCSATFCDVTRDLDVCEHDFHEPCRSTTENRHDVINTHWPDD